MIFGVMEVFRLNGRSVDPVVGGVGTYEADKHDSCVVVNPRDKAVMISRDVEDDPISWQEIGGRVPGRDVVWRFPSGGLGFVEPCFQGCLRIRMPFVEIS